MGAHCWMRSLSVSMADTIFQYVASFTAEELFRATNGFKNCFRYPASGGMFKGSFEQRPIDIEQGTSFVRNCIENASKPYYFLNPAILGDGGGGAEQDQQIDAFLALALKCTQDEREDRPDMIDVVKELRRIERSTDSSSLAPSN